MSFNDDVKKSYDWAGNTSKANDNVYFFKKAGSGEDQPKSYTGTPAWYDLKGKAQVWARAVVKLANTPVPPRLAPKKADLLKRARFIKTALEKIFGSIQGVSDMNLGIAPLVVGAGAISAAALLITKWYYDNNKLTKELSSGIYNDLIKKGASPAKAAEIAAKIAGSSEGFFDQARRLAPWIIGGALLYLFRHKISSLAK
jgi:hypothetical protein